MRRLQQFDSPIFVDILATKQNLFLKFKLTRLICLNFPPKGRIFWLPVLRNHFRKYCSYVSKLAPAAINIEEDFTHAIRSSTSAYENFAI